MKQLVRQGEMTSSARMPPVEEIVVTSIKIIARDTVEHRVMAMQEKKRALISALPDDADLSELIG